MKSVGKVAGVAGLAIASGIAVGLTKSVGAAKEAEVAQVSLESALKSAGVSFKDHASQIDNAIQLTSKLAALDDEDLSESFSKLVRTTGSVTQATTGMNLAADIARARHVSLEAATKSVERAFVGSAQGLRRYGVVVGPVTDEQDKLKLSIDALKERMKGANAATKDAIELRIKELAATKPNAIALDNQATGLKAVAEAQKQFKGSAEAYGKTSAAASERFNVALENLQERVGQKLLPVLAKLTNWAADFLDWSTLHWPQVEKVIVKAFDAIQPSIKDVIDIATVLRDTIVKHWDTIERNMLALKTIVVDELKIVRSAIEFVSDLLHGKWGEAWQDAKDIVKTEIDLVKTYLVNMLDNIKGAALALGKAALNGIKEGVTGLGVFFLDTLKGLNTMLNNKVDDLQADALSLGRGVLNGIKEGITGVGEFVLGVVTGLKEMLVNQLDEMKTKATNLGKSVFSGIVAGVTGVGAAVWETIKAIGTKITDMVDVVKGWGDNVGKWIRDAAGDGITGIVGKIWNVINNIPGFLLDKIDVVKGWGADLGGWIKDALIGGLDDLGTSVVKKIESELKAAAKSAPSAVLSFIPGRGDASNPNLTLADVGGGGNFGGSLMGALPVMAPFAAQAARYGLHVSSGLRPGAITKHGTLSDHAVGKALDVADGPAGMAAFFTSLIGNPRVKQAFYDPLGSIFGGVLNAYREGGHSDHVHVATYDRGGWLAPFSKTLAINRTPYWEPVGPPGRGGGDIYVTVNGWVGNDQQIADRVRNALMQKGRRNGGNLFGGLA